MGNREVWGYANWKSLDLFPLIRQVEQVVGFPCLCMGVTGSHCWGLATEDSDLDIRGIYHKPLEQILSIHKGRDTVERVNRDDEGMSRFDVQFYEIEKACGMLLSGNGNLVELLLSPSTFYWTTAGKRLQEIARKGLSRRLKDYYRGYATSQRRRACLNRGGKALVYTFRECFSGIWLMRTGEIEYDFRTLWLNIEREGIYFSKVLTRIFDRPKWEVVSADEMQEFESEWEELTAILDLETERSILPPSINFYDDLNDLLLHVRHKGIYEFPPKQIDTGHDLR